MNYLSKIIKDARQDGAGVASPQRLGASLREWLPSTDPMAMAEESAGPEPMSVRETVSCHPEMVTVTQQAIPGETSLPPAAGLRIPVNSSAVNVTAPPSASAIGRISASGDLYPPPLPDTLLPTEHKEPAPLRQVTTAPRQAEHVSLQSPVARPSATIFPARNDSQPQSRKQQTKPAPAPFVTAPAVSGPATDSHHLSHTLPSVPIAVTSLQVPSASGTPSASDDAVAQPLPDLQPSFSRPTEYRDTETTPSVSAPGWGGQPPGEGRALFHEQATLQGRANEVRVHIGRVDIVVMAPESPRQGSSVAPAPTDLASRLYLRRL